MGIAPEGLRHDPFELGLDVIHRLSRGEPRTIADAEDVGVDRESLLPERGVEHHIRRLATDARERLQFLARAGNFAVDQRLAKRDHVLGLGIEQADGLDRFTQRLFAEFDHLLRRLDTFEQRSRGDVDASVGCLGG